MKTRQIYGLPFHGGSAFPYPAYRLNIPPGLRVRECDDGTGQFFIEELPYSIFPKNSALRSDADHYGVRLNRDQVDAGETSITLTFGTEDAADRFYRVLLALIAGKCGLRSICVSIRDLARKSKYSREIKF